MATGQARSVYGMGIGGPLRTPYAQQIQSAYGQATADVIARKKKEAEEEAMKFDQKVATDNLALNKAQFQLSQDQAKLEAENAKRAMGMNIGTLGMNLGGRAANNPALTIKNSGKGLLSPIMPSSGINLGSLAGSGLAGYGAYQAMGGGTKGLAAGLGAGLLTDSLSGGGIGGTLLNVAKKVPGVDSVLSGLGSIFSGLF